MNENHRNMICSTIIPTIGRQSLSRAVKSVLGQNLEEGDFEVIVVNDSGNLLALEDWMESPRVRILHTNRHNRSIARNTGAAVARGGYLHFLDDDDWMLPGAFQNLLQQAKIAGQAGWIYGGFRLVDNEGETVKDFHPRETGNCFIHMLASEWIPLQASWINAGAFFKVGGFASLNSLEGGYEDIDLSRMISRYYDFSRTSELVAAIRYGDVGSTTDYNNLVKQNRRSREKNLDFDGVFARLWASAQADDNHPDYWQGQILYYYLVSILWNLKQKQILKAASRLMFALLAFVVSIPSALSSDFWRGVFHPHHNLVRTALGELENKLYTQTTWKR
jgi:glycosyltransferase involved in cell wall biosynthesis